jgi:pimeloyl-ACP methyl ester carboxylesterase
VFHAGLGGLTADLATEARCGALAAGKLLRGRVRDGFTGHHPLELRVGSLPEPPVLLVHGLGADKSCFSTMADRLHREGYTVSSAAYSCLDTDIHSCARTFERQAAWVLAQTGSSRLHVVAHSLGGVVLRWAWAHTAMSDQISVAVTLGSPHRGTPTARLAPSALPGYGRIISQLRPGLLGEVGHGVSSDTRWVAVGARHDWVVPPAFAKLPATDNVRNAVVSTGGHMSLTSNPECLDIILEELAAGGAQGVDRAIVAVAA